MLSTDKSRAFKESRAEVVLLFRILSAVFITTQPETGGMGGERERREEGNQNKNRIRSLLNVLSCRFEDIFKNKTKRKHFFFLEKRAPNSILAGLRGSSY